MISLAMAREAARTALQSVSGGRGTLPLPSGRERLQMTLSQRS